MIKRVDPVIILSNRNQDSNIYKRGKSMEPVNETQKTNETVNDTPTQETPKEPEVIIIRMWPKTPVLYPMAILALIFSLIGLFAGSTPHIRALNKIYKPAVQEQLASVEASTASADIPSSTTIDTSVPAPLDTAQIEDQSRRLIDGLFLDKLMGGIFLLVFAFSLFTLSVDLEVRWALFTFASILVVILLLVLINQRYEFLPGVISTIISLSPMANPQFYFAIFLIWVILMAISFGIIRFHYVTIESNEVIVVGGLLERQQRFPTMRMRYTRDIQDVFEYYLPFVRSGRLILSFAEQSEAVVIDNVLNIDKVTEQLDKVSGVLHVKDK